MKCELCQQNEATVTIGHTADGKPDAVHLCESCAAQKGVKLAVPLLTDLLLGTGERKRGRSDAPEKSCPSCRLKLSDFRRGSLLGCPACYGVFGDEVASYLQSVQKGDQHMGKVPAAHRIASELAELQKSLQDAVRAQDFEQAAKLRDLMREVQMRRRDCVSSGETLSRE